MLSKDKKLDRKDHLIVLKSGKKIYKNHFFIQYLENDLEITKCTVSVSKKLARKAVQRNNIKRKIFNLIKKTYPQFRPGYTLVIIPQKPILEIVIDDVEKELLTIIKPFLFE